MFGAVHPFSSAGRMGLASPILCSPQCWLGIGGCFIVIDDVVLRETCSAACGRRHRRLSWLKLLSGAAGIVACYAGIANRQIVKSTLPLVRLVAAEQNRYRRTVVDGTRNF